MYTHPQSPQMINSYYEFWADQLS